MLGTPSAEELNETVRALREWQYDRGAVQLHPGDLGWHWSSGAQATATAVRTWSRNGQILAVGLLDGPELLRLAIAPAVQDDEQLTQQLVADITAPERSVLPQGRVAIESRSRGSFQEVLLTCGWKTDELWTPLRRDLTDPVENPGVRVEAIGPDRAYEYTAVHRSSFDSQSLTDERWRTMAAGFVYADARSLVAYDDTDTAVAVVTVWSAGPGRPGLLEPMGVHRDHQGLGFGRAISVAAAAALQEMGASSATVCTPSSNIGGVATYMSAGFHQLPEVPDLRRNA